MRGHTVFGDGDVLVALLKDHMHGRSGLEDMPLWRFDIHVFTLGQKHIDNREDGTTFFSSHFINPAQCISARIEATSLQLQLLSQNFFR